MGLVVSILPSIKHCDDLDVDHLNVKPPDPNRNPHGPGGVYFAWQRTSGGYLATTGYDQVRLHDDCDDGGGGHNDGGGDGGGGDDGGGDGDDDDGGDGDGGDGDCDDDADADDDDDCADDDD